MRPVRPCASRAVCRTQSYDCAPLHNFHFSGVLQSARRLVFSSQNPCFIDFIQLERFTYEPKKSFWSEICQL